ncbi:MAG: glycosyl hydrolase [Phycisphaeraceae bacterium]
MRIKAVLFIAILAILLPTAALAQVTNPNLADTDETLKQVTLTRGARAIDRVEESRYILRGDSTLILQAADKPIGNGEVHLDSEDAVLIIEKVHPTRVHDELLDKLRIDGGIAKLGVNVRLAPYVNGTLVQPHGTDYQPLITYSQTRYKGEGRSFSLHKYYKAKELGEDNDRINSFVLTRGYIATFAANQDGTGESKVYIARDRDLKIAQLPSGLREAVSFIRVFPWRWTGKKGFGGKHQNAVNLACHWRYDWGAGGRSTLDMEYVAMKHNGKWPTFKQINGLQDVNHLLGFNEPMKVKQGNLSMEACLKLWPKLQESGLRLGSPCTTDGTVDWLYEFMDKANARGYRVDFVTVHYYKGGWSDERFIAWMRQIHEKTGLPLWVTEFNNGADWVKGHNPSPVQNADALLRYSKVMDQCDFIERYAVFNLHHGNRAVVTKAGELTPAGRAYRDNESAEAYLGR